MRGWAEHPAYGGWRRLPMPVGRVGYRRHVARLFCAGAVLGAVLFLLLYGPAGLDPTNEEWLLAANSDLTQHYLGWRFYRQGGWHFPLGLTEGMSYPYSVSILYSDSIPLLAVPFKLLSPFLPGVFQYFGWWGLLCFALAGGFGAALLRFFTKNSLFCMVGALVFVLSPPMLMRMFAHSALAGHWLVLAALWLGLNDGLLGWRQRAAGWCGLLLLASWVHPYFLPMVYLPLCGCALQRGVVCGGWLRQATLAAGALLAALAGLWLLGAFTGGVDQQGGGLRSYGMNLNAFFNPLDAGRLLPERPVVRLQGEGYPYLGAGVLAALVVAAVWHALRLWRCIRARRGGGGKSILRAVPLWALCTAGTAGVLLVLAIGPIVAYGGRELFTLPYPALLERAMSIFRVTGRLAWPVGYMLVLLALRALAGITGALPRRWPRRALAVVAVAAMAFAQYADSRDLIGGRAAVTRPGEYQPRLQDEGWEEIGGVAHVVLSQLPEDMALQYSLAAWASDKGATLSNFYLARQSAYTADTAKPLYGEVTAGTLPADTVLVMTEPNHAWCLAWQAEADVWVYEMDGLWVATPAPLGGKTPAQAADGPANLLDGSFATRLYDSEWLEGGGVRIGAAGGDVRGQLLYLRPGRYRATFVGGGLDPAQCRVYSGALGDLDDVVITAEDGALYAVFTLEEEVFDLELWLANAAEEAVVLDELWLEKLE